MAHRVKCVNCGLIFDRDKVPFVPVGSRRYAHANCSDYLEDTQDLEELEAYILKTLKLDYIDAKTRLQLNNFRDIQNYTYKGMLKSLTYFHEVRGNQLTGVGIIPYVYEQAQKYYAALWLTRQTNEAKPIEQYIAPVERIICIPEPQSPKRDLRRLFNFIDE